MYVFQNMYVFSFIHDMNILIINRVKVLSSSLECTGIIYRERSVNNQNWAAPAGPRLLFIAWQFPGIQKLCCKSRPVCHPLSQKPRQGREAKAAGRSPGLAKYKTATLSYHICNFKFYQKFVYERYLREMIQNACKVIKNSMIIVTT